MTTVITPSIEEFANNKLLRQHYTERQLEALYKLLQDKRLGPHVDRILLGKGLILLELRTKPVEGLLAGYLTETVREINIIGEQL